MRSSANRIAAAAAAAAATNSVRTLASKPQPFPSTMMSLQIPIKGVGMVAELASFATAATAAVVMAAAMPGTRSSPLMAPATVKEAATGIEFNTVDGSGLQLLGTGCRYKFGIVKVYAVGLYASESAGSGDGSIFENLLYSSGDKTVLIKMSYSITAKQLIDSLNDAFKPRLALTGRSLTGMDQFSEVIIDATKGSCSSGDEIKLQCLGGNILQVTVTKAGGGGIAYGKAAVADADVCFALLDTYLGAGSIESVSPTLKKSITATFSS